MKMGVGLGAKAPSSDAGGEEAPPIEKKHPPPLDPELGQDECAHAAAASEIGAGGYYEVRFGLVATRRRPVECDDSESTIDWQFIWRTSHAQFFLSMISSLSLLISLHFTGFNVFRFTSSAWATYLACVSVVGIRAGRYRNYCYLIAYAGMVMFQTVVYMSSLCWLAYSLYALDSQVNYAQYRNGHVVYGPVISHDLAMGLIIIEVVSLLCTIFTGLFGLIAVCRGIGTMMHQMEYLLLQDKLHGARASPPQITVRPLV